MTHGAPGSNQASIVAAVGSLDEDLAKYGVWISDQVGFAPTETGAVKRQEIVQVCEIKPMQALCLTLHTRTWTRASSF